jgi:DNA polymerase III subunit epsilon
MLSRTLNLTRPLVALDLETTGLHVENDRIVEISCIKMLPNGQKEVWTQRLNPERPISPEAMLVHGITKEDLRDKPPFNSIASALYAFLENCDLTGFNLERFDLPMLGFEFKRAGFTYPNPDICVLDSRKIYTMKEPRDLCAAYQLYCNAPLTHAHSAEADAQAAADILYAQISRYEDLPTCVEDLDSLCRPDKAQRVDPEGKLRWHKGEVILAFGKYRNQSLKEVAQKDRSYLEWVARANFAPDIITFIQMALDGVDPSPEDRLCA